MDEGTSPGESEPMPALPPVPAELVPRLRDLVRAAALFRGIVLTAAGRDEVQRLARRQREALHRAGKLVEQWRDHIRCETENLREGREAPAEAHDLSTVEQSPAPAASASDRHGADSAAIAAVMEAFREQMRADKIVPIANAPGFDASTGFDCLDDAIWFVEGFIRFAEDVPQDEREAAAYHDIALYRGGCILAVVRRGAGGQIEVTRFAADAAEN